MNEIKLRRILILALSMMGLCAAVCALVSAAGSVHDKNHMSGNSLAQRQKEGVSLPVFIEDSCIVAERLVNYSGIYLEDGMQQTVENIAALRIYNAGDQMLDAFRIKVDVGSDCFIFDGSCLPPGHAMLLQEIDAKTYTANTIRSVQITLQEGPADLNRIEGLEVDGYMGGVQLTNSTQTDFTDLRIYHKTFLPDENLYLGGITYVTCVDHLGAGEGCTAWPVNYTQNSRIIYITGN